MNNGLVMQVARCRPARWISGLEAHSSTILNRLMEATCGGNGNLSTLMRQVKLN